MSVPDVTAPSGSGHPVTGHPLQATAAAAGRRTRRWIGPGPLAGLAALALLAGCATDPTPAPETLTLDVAMALPDSPPMPAIKTFGPVEPAPPARSNAEMAQDFLDLAFLTETGRALPVMTRFTGPISLTMTGPRPPTADRDLAAVLLRLRREAHVDIGLAPAGAPANITIQFLARATMQAVVPNAACFVTPNVSTWQQYRRVGDTPQSDWTRLTVRRQLAIFIPDDTTPQDIRDCLNEELAQAVGPIDDLYRLPDSVFNDDNFNSVLTGFDMLMVRIYNDPALRNGMTRAQAAAIVPGLLRRYNPAGEGRGGTPLAPAPRDWKRAIEAAIGAEGTPASRQRAALNAVQLARDYGWTDARLGLSWFSLGRLSMRGQTAQAVAAFARAAQIYRSLPGTGIHLAHIDMQMAAFALQANQPDVALRIARHDIPVTLKAQNAALLSSFYMIEARALELQGKPAAARPLWSLGLAWGRYGFGPVRAVRLRQAEVQALGPAPDSQGPAAPAPGVRPRPPGPDATRADRGAATRAAGYPATAAEGGSGG